MQMSRFVITAALAWGLISAASVSPAAAVPSDSSEVSVLYTKFKGWKGPKIKFKKAKHYSYYGSYRPTFYRYRYYRHSYGYYRPRSYHSGYYGYGYGSRRCYCR